FTLVGEDGNDKMLVPRPMSELMTEDEMRSIDEYDRLFEKYSMYCNGRWLGAQVLQDAQDLMYLQHVVTAIRPAVIIETGTYKGGLTYYFATLMDSLGIQDGRIITIDRNPPEKVWGASWFCPVCEECIRVWETDPWQRRVEFLPGWADDQGLYATVRERIKDAQGPVMVNLDACHEYDCVYVEIMIYAPLVTVGSILVVQDAKLDKLWGKPAVNAAIDNFLSQTDDFVRDRSIEYYGYSQHVYLRRVAKTMQEPDVSLPTGAEH
ncbi:unnamed protein product, partial [Polarella glacialis]